MDSINTTALRWLKAQLQWEDRLAALHGIEAPPTARVDPEARASVVDDDLGPLDLVDDVVESPLREPVVVGRRP